MRGLPPQPTRTDRKRLIGCAVVIVLLLILVVLAVYALGLFSGGQPAPNAHP